MSATATKVQRIGLDSRGINKAIRSITERQAQALAHSIKVGARARRMGMTEDAVFAVWRARGACRVLALVLSQEGPR